MVFHISIVLIGLFGLWIIDQGLVELWKEKPELKVFYQTIFVLVGLYQSYLLFDYTVRHIIRR